MKSYISAGMTVAVALLAGCADELPTATSPDLVPSAPRSVEIFLPYGDVVESLQLFEGFGTVANMPFDLLANDFEGALDARVLARFGSFPRVIQAPDPEGTTRTDSLFTVIGGRVVARLDTASISPDEILLRAGALTAPWDVGSASWEIAVDTAGRQLLWPEAGGGPVEFQDSVRWRRAEQVDSVLFEVDSATVADWMDLENEARGVRIVLGDAGPRLRVRDVRLRIHVRPSFNEDEPIFVPAGSGVTTFIYSPEPEAPADALRFGGAPAWRSVLGLSLPASLVGPPELCDAFGCPLDLRPELVSHASLVLVTRATPPHFRAQDSLRLEIRPVLRPDLLPKSPLGAALTNPSAGGIAPAVFGQGAGEVVEVPLTPYIQNLIQGGGEGGTQVPSRIAILSPFEPLSFMFGDFEGPGSAAPPRLRLILTRSDEVDLP